MGNFICFSSPVEKIVENVWKMCGKAVGKVGRFTQNLYAVCYDEWKNIKMYTIFVVSCGKFSTGFVNKFFAFNRGKWRKIGGFTHFPHTLLL